MPLLYLIEAKTLATDLSENCNLCLRKKGHRAYGWTMPLICNLTQVSKEDQTV